MVMSVIGYHMRVLVLLLILICSSAFAFGQIDSTKSTQYPNFNSIHRLKSGSQIISRDSALVYMNGKFYTIDQLDYMGSKFESVKFIQNPDSIALFTAKKLKVILWIKE